MQPACQRCSARGIKRVQAAAVKTVQRTLTTRLKHELCAAVYRFMPLFYPHKNKHRQHFADKKLYYSTVLNVLCRNRRESCVYGFALAECGCKRIGRP